MLFVRSAPYPSDDLEVQERSVGLNEAAAGREIDQSCGELNRRFGGVGKRQSSGKSGCHSRRKGASGAMGVAGLYPRVAPPTVSTIREPEDVFDGVALFMATGVEQCGLMLDGPSAGRYTGQDLIELIRVGTHDGSALQQAIDGC